MRILVLPKYHQEGSSSRYRYYNYFEWFLNAGHEVTCRPLLYDGYVHDLYSNKNQIKRLLGLIAGIFRRITILLRHKSKFDIIVIEKELITFMPFFIEKFLLKNSKFIVDYDDNVNARYQVGWAKIFLENKIKNIANIASAVTVGNHWYFDLYKDIPSSKIHYLPTVIDSYQYAATSIVIQANKPVTIVWIGSPSTAKYLRLIDDVLAGLQSGYDFTLKVIGATIDLKCKTVFVEWNAETEIEELKQSDIGIMPLGNSDWDKGKCGLKLIQYMACGLPVLASYTKANEEIISHNCGFIAMSDAEWVESLSLLLQSEALRSSLGENGKRRIYTQYSYQTWAPVFIQLLEDIFSAKN